MMQSLLREFHFPESNYFLFGPRGTGKSTLLLKTYKDAFYLDLLQHDNFRAYSAHPEKLREVIHGLEGKKIVIIDEIQRIPELLNQVHSLIENEKDILFIMTGSSARKLKKEGTNLLAGRAFKKSMHPFTASELGSLFSIEEALTTGLIPVIFSSKDKKEALKSYVDLYLREEVMMEGLTRNIGNFSRFLEVISFSHGSQININNIARESNIGRKTIESYVQILEYLMIAFRLPIFTKRAQRNLATHPKFYFYDTGLYMSLRPAGPLDTPEEIGGAALEGLVYQHLRAYIDHKNRYLSLYFWRTKSGNEVDFIIYGESLFAAIEIKSSSQIRKNDLNGLKSFGEDYDMATRILVYRGKEVFIRDGVMVVPAELFLKTPEKYLL
jgi:uncharacterized protein